MTGTDVNERLLATLAARYGDSLGDEAPVYLEHVRRVLAFYERLSEAPPDDDAVVAAFFHDLGIWTAKTNDYLPPSAAAARAWLAERGETANVETVAAMIEWHHKLTPFRGPAEGIDALAVERFRKADLIDFSWGLYHGGLPRAEVRAVFRAHPPGSFRRWLVGLLSGWLVRHPARPFPVLRW